MNTGNALPSIYLRFEIRADSPRLRNPSLERLLAVADSSEVVSDWRAEVQRLLCGPTSAVLDVAPVSYFQDRAPLPAIPVAQVFLVSALHARASLVSVGLPANGLLRLTEHEARLLAEDFNAVFGGGTRSHLADAVQLVAGADGRLYAVFASEVRARTLDPALAIGQDLWDFRPRGEDAARLARLGSELEMWLFDHAVNRLRREQGELEITALWLWGGGSPLTAMPPAPFDVIGEDALFSAWSTLGGVRTPSAGRLLVCAAAPAEQGFDAHAQAALDASHTALRRGVIRAVYLSSGRQCRAVRRMPRRFVFRRGKPWWDYFDDTD